MRSRAGQVFVRRKPFIRRGWSQSCPRSTRVIAWTMLLVAVSLMFATVAGFGQGTAVGTGDPAPGQARIAALQEDTPQAPAETPIPPVETTEPAPSETAEPPPEITPTTPGEPPEPEATPGQTPGPGDTVEPVPTEPPATAPTAIPTRAGGIWPTDWPLGTVRIGEEAPPTAEPVQVMTQEWFRLVLALVVVTLVAILGGRALYRLLRTIIRRRHLEVDESLLSELRPLLSWWLAAIGFHISIWWVSFQNEAARVLFADLAFLAYLGVATLTVWRLVDRAIDLYATRIAAEGQAATVEKLRPTMRRWARVLILLFSVLVALGRLDVGFSVPTILVLLLGLTISLAARDTLTDIIAGFSILVDQPYRIGDRIQVQGVDSWAQVLNIGLRSSVLLTRRNVEIIMPNSTIGKNQVINYSYPDSRYRMQTHVDVAYGTNVEHARQVLIDAVRQAAVVLPDEPVDALYVEIGDSAMIFRVRWWIDCYQDWEEAYDCVHTALHNALDEAGIESPYPSQNLSVEVDDQTLADVWQAWQGEGETGSTE
jgi:MscS family membrane protein